MKRELWDAYDLEGRPLGFDLVRGEPVPEGVRHLVVEVLSVTTDGRVLVTRRHPNKPWGGCWEYTGGSVLKGETPLAGALRELREETGIAASPEELLPVYVAPGWEPAIYHCFLTFFDPAEQPVRLQEGETVEYRLLSYAEFKRFILGEGFVEMIRQRFLDHQEIFDRLIAEHFEKK